MNASFTGDGSAVKKLLLETDLHNVNGPEETTGRTAVIYAAIGGHVNCLNPLLKAGASANGADHLGITALMYVTIYGDRLNCLDLLLKSGASVNRKDHKKNTALSYAVQKKRVSCIVALMNSGAYLHQFHEDGNTLLGMAALSSQYCVMNLLLTKGVSVGQLDKAERRTALMLSVETGHVGCTAALLKAGADVNQPQGSGKTALMVAAKESRYECIKLLLKKGADVNQWDGYGKDALMYVLSLNLSGGGPDYKCVKELIEAGADVNAASNSDVTALGYYLQNHCWDAICYTCPCWVSHFIGETCDTNLLPFPASQGAILELLFQHGSQINRCDHFFDGHGELFLPTDLYWMLKAAGQDMKVFSYIGPRDFCNLRIRRAQPSSMKELCRDRIRCHLLKLDAHTNLFLRIPHLAPKPLARYLLYNRELLPTMVKGVGTLIKSGTKRSLSSCPESDTRKKQNVVDVP